MTRFLQQIRGLLRRSKPAPPQPKPARPLASAPLDAVSELDLAANDPLRAYLLTGPGVLDLEQLRLESPIVTQLRAEGTRLLVPLLSQGELVGLLTLGPRLSEQAYTSDDRALLASLATQAAPALRVAQLIREQRAEARERERIAQELRVARIIQQTLLPREVPAIAGWAITPYYAPAREVGGDFYDFISLANGMLGLLVADVTDKGVPAGLVMATTRSVLRAAATRLESPGQVLARVNDIIHPDIPTNMFVTCFYAVLNPLTGELQFANAGHDLPYLRSRNGSLRELRARGMPLGLMPAMVYEEGYTQIEIGDHLLLYSDGVVEAHDPQRAMFSFERLERLVGGAAQGGQALIDTILTELSSFTGAGWVQEDDITMVALERLALAAPTRIDSGWQELARLEITSAPDNEQRAMLEVAALVAPLGIPAVQLERLKTAVAEATMNAMEHGNQYRADQPVQLSIRATAATLAVRIIDHGVGSRSPHEPPDLAAKLAGRQAPRGWGLHLIRHMVDDVREYHEDGRHIVELLIALQEKHDAPTTV